MQMIGNEILSYYKLIKLSLVKKLVLFLEISYLQMKRVKLADMIDAIKILKNNFVAPHGACTLFNTNELKKIGGYSEEIKSQDGWEIWFKLKERNQIKSVNNIIFYYRQHSNSVSKKKNLILSRNKIIEKISNTSFGDYNLKSLAVVPIKENYDDIKNIPFLKFKNVSLIDRTLETICSTKINHILVSTSSNKIISYLKKKKYKKKIFVFKRNKKFENSVSSLEDILINSTQKFIDSKKQKPDIVFFFSIHTIRFENSQLIELLIYSNLINLILYIQYQRNKILLLSLMVKNIHY